MRPVDRAIWFIESHFEQEITLDDVAVAAGVSRFHLTKAFGYATGTSVMRYLRHRRLTVAARALAEGESDILDLALRLAYGSHEAFTRAFRDHFGVTPSEVREQRSTRTLTLQEALMPSQPEKTDLQPPRIVEGPTLLIAGLSRTYGVDASARIPAQWQEFGPIIGNVPGQVGQVAYGVILGGDDEGNHAYLSGVEVASFDALPENLARERLPARRYAVFVHPGHVSAMRATWNAIWSDWLPDSQWSAVDAPSFERYTETFDPLTGNGGFEIWIPVEPATKAP